MTEEEEDAIIMKEIKQTTETLESAPSDREDIIKQSKDRLAVLREFAPSFMGEDEINAIIDQVLAELGLKNPTPMNKGVIMKKLMPQVKGKAEGSVVNQLVMKRLQ